MELQRFFLFANPNKPESFPLVKRFAALCTSWGGEVFSDTWLQEYLQTGTVMPTAAIDDSIDIIVSFGGDGTLLRVVPNAAAHQIPILGVNMGHTGFLLEIDPEGLEEALDKLLSGDFRQYERTLLQCDINGGNSNLALNEIALTRGQNPSSLVVDVWYQDELVYTIHGDGVLVSTTTGTTGYSLSAGGPIIYPEIPCTAVVPICSHIMHQRAVILPLDGVIRLNVRKNRGMMHQISMDGQVVFDMTSTSEVVVRKAPQKVRFIHFAPQQFLTRLREKQAEWSNFVYGGEL